MKNFRQSDSYFQRQAQTMGKVMRGKSAYWLQGKVQQPPKHKRPEGGVSDGATNSNQDNSR